MGQARSSSTGLTLRALLLASIALSALAAGPAFAQQSPRPDETPVGGGAAPGSVPAAGGDETEVEEVVVTASGKPYGSVIGDIPPEITLSPAEIRATGATTVGELITALTNELTSGANTGPPIVLLNGHRIPSTRDIQQLPQEALLRTEILPEEVATKYGYRPDQKVMNVVLRPRFRATAVKAGAGSATQGGREHGELNVANFRINRDNLYLLDGTVSATAGVLESDRGIAQPSSRFDLLGNVLGTGPGGEIDPSLSALAGRTVTQAAAPAGAASGAASLGQFAAGAGALNVTDIGRYRTARGNGDEGNLSLNATLTRPVLGIYTAFNARFEADAEETLLGLPNLTLSLPAGSPYSPFSRTTTVYRYVDLYGPLLQNTQQQTAHLGAAANHLLPWGDWRWQFSANLDRRRSLTETDRGVDPAPIQAGLNAGDPAVNPFGAFGSTLATRRPRDESLSVRTSGDAQFTASGSLHDLPAGPIRASITTAMDAQVQERETRRSGVRDEADLSRQHGRLSVDLDLPLFRRGRIGPVGDFTLNLNGEAEQYSDFGTLTSLEYGFRWTPIRPINLRVAMRQEENAPSLDQLGAPTIFTPQVQVFDFTRGETVEVTRVTGGNPNLNAESRRFLRINLNLRPWQAQNLFLYANYQLDRRENSPGNLGAITAELEAAFPERFVRDASGRLTTYDVRPVNFAERRQETLNLGISFAKIFRPAQPTRPGQPGQAGQPARPGAGDGARGGGARPGGGFGPGGPGGFGGGPGGPGGGGAFGGLGAFGGGGAFAAATTVRVSLSDLYTLEDTTLIRQGVPRLDALAGIGGQTPRHRIRGELNVARRGVGLTIQPQWQSATVVRGGTLSTPRDLFFDDFGRVNASVWFDAGGRPDVVRKHPVLRGARIDLTINNLFDARQQVRDADGVTPINYQPDLLDPVGRTFQLSFRKLFLPPRPVRPRGQGGPNGQGGPDFRPRQDGARPAQGAPPR